MTTKIDGNNGVLQSYDYQVLTTGFSYTFATGITTLLIEPAGTLATGTITMPASPADGMVITFSSTQQITALTVAANTGQSIKGNSVQAIPNQPLSWVYRLTNTTWYAMAGGAARASNVVSGTSVASTSGTSIDFTGLPSWVKRITVMFNGVSTNGTSFVNLQIGAGSIQNTGYLSYGAYAGASNSTAGAASTTAFLIDMGGPTAATLRYGTIVLSLLDSTTGTWTGVSNLGFNVSAVYYMFIAGGTKSLSGTLDRVRITTVNGTDTFDAGSINILYE
jgi:hypothetical protein